MNNTSDLGKDNTPTISKAMRHFIFAFVQDSINQPDNFERNKKWLKGYCKNEKLNYPELESNLNVFFELLEEYCRNGTPVLYRFLKLQSQNCFIDEERFDLLKIIPGEHDSIAEIQNSSAYCHDKNTNSSSEDSGIVGGHIIGL